jgi:hypothetical protein
LRRVWLDGRAVREVIPDVLTLSGMAVVLLAVGVGAFALGMRHARRTGTLAHY